MMTDKSGSFVVIMKTLLETVHIHRQSPYIQKVHFSKYRLYQVLQKVVQRMKKCTTFIFQKHDERRLIQLSPNGFLMREYFHLIIG